MFCIPSIQRTQFQILFRKLFALMKCLYSFHMQRYYSECEWVQLFFPCKFACMILIMFKDFLTFIPLVWTVSCIATPWNMTELDKKNFITEKGHRRNMISHYETATKVAQLFVNTFLQKLFDCFYFYCIFRFHNMENVLYCSVWNIVDFN